MTETETMGGGGRRVGEEKEKGGGEAPFRLSKRIGVSGYLEGKRKYCGLLYTKREGEKGGWQRKGGGGRGGWNGRKKGRERGGA